MTIYYRLLLICVLFGVASCEEISGSEGGSSGSGGGSGTGVGSNYSFDAAKDDELRQRIVDYIQRKAGVNRNKSDFETYLYKGVYFYFEGSASTSRKNEYKTIIQTTIDVMDTKVSNSDVWDSYNSYPFYIAEDTTVYSGGAAASFTNRVIWCYTNKLRLTRDNFSPVIPHELGHFVQDDFDSTVSSPMESFYNSHLGRLNTNEQEDSWEYFSNSSEAYFYWSNESFPDDTSDLQAELPDLYNFLGSFYSAANKSAANKNLNDDKISLSNDLVGWKDWTIGPEYAVTTANKTNEPENYSVAYLDSRSSDFSRIESKPLDLQNYKTVNISFNAQIYDTRSAAETFSLQFFYAGNWTTLETLQPGIDFGEDSATSFTYQLASSQYVFEKDNRFKFVADSDVNSENPIFLNQVLISGER